jgi:hypothetical protein
MINKIRRAFLYFKHYYSLDSRQLRKEAYNAAVKFYKKYPVRSKDNPYPRAFEYDKRREEFKAYQRSYIRVKRSMHAKAMMVDC